MAPALESGLFALGGVIIGSVISPWITNKLAERNRQAETYKIIFLEKMKACQRIISVAGFLQMYAQTFIGERQSGKTEAGPEHVLREYSLKRSELSVIYFDTIWLVGEALDAAIGKYTRVISGCMAAGFDVDDETVHQLNTAFLELQRAIRGEMHMGVFERLYESSPTEIGFLKSIASENKTESLRRSPSSPAPSQPPVPPPLA